MKKRKRNKKCFSLHFRSERRHEVIQSTNENNQTICDVPDPVENRGVLYEPPYLFEKDLYPNYSMLAVSMRGYDYVVLEGYFRYIQKLAKSLDVNVFEAYVFAFFRAGKKSRIFSVVFQFQLNHLV